MSQIPISSLLYLLSSLCRLLCWGRACALCRSNAPSMPLRQYTVCPRGHCFQNIHQCNADANARQIKTTTQSLLTCSYALPIFPSGKVSKRSHKQLQKACLCDLKGPKVTSTVRPLRILYAPWARSSPAPDFRFFSRGARTFESQNAVKARSAGFGFIENSREHLPGKYDLSVKPLRFTAHHLLLLPPLPNLHHHSLLPVPNAPLPRRRLTPPQPHKLPPASSLLLNPHTLSPSHDLRVFIGPAGGGGLVVEIGERIEL